MKSICALSFLLFSLTLTAIEYPNVKPLPVLIDGKKIPNVKPILGDYLYIGETEVTNQQYKDFLYWLKKNSPGDYNLNLPDTTQWNTVWFGVPYVNYYFQHPAYKNYPLVNVSQRQAVNYCNWLHDSLERYFLLKKSKIDKFIVRLPTEKEWMIAARGGLPETAVYPWEGTDIRRLYKGRSAWELNCRNDINYDFSNGKAFNTTEVHSYWPNGYGLYNMSGNVAEWISEQGKTKGGNWNLPPYNARIDVPGYQDGDTTAKPDIGFRYIVEVISVKDEFKPMVFDNKYFEKHLLFIPDTIKANYLFAGDRETTNAEYNTFLKENNLPEYQIASENWSRYFSYKYYEMYGWHSGFGNFPVVNISYKAALAYCEWLSKKYNSLEKRKYKKVVFRLPNEKEWEWLASGSLLRWLYPWGGNGVQNSKGCYLANFCPLEEQYYYKTDTIYDRTYLSPYMYKYPNGDWTISRGIDGNIIPAPSNSYFPNDYGLYNCSGNVAEMINEFGITKGGSWNSNDYFIQIRSNEKYISPAPTIGFRVVMEVLEK